MKDSIRNLIDQRGQIGDQDGTILLIAGIMIVSVFFGFMIFDTYRMRKRFGQFKRRKK